MIKVEKTIIEQLTWRGVLAYIAVRIADGKEISTAALAALVKCPSTVMREGLKELAVIAPGAVHQHDKKWVCGVVEAGDGKVVDGRAERFVLFVDDLKKYWDHLNPGIKFQMGGKDGVQIRNFLNDNPSWTEVEWRQALKHRATSVVKHDCASRSEAIFSWVGHLGRYLAGPMNKFGRPVEGNGGGKQQQIQDRNSEAVAAYLNGARRP